MTHVVHGTLATAFAVACAIAHPGAAAPLSFAGSVACGFLWLTIIGRLARV